MKSIATIACLLFATSLVSAETQPPATTTSTPPATVKTPAAKVTPPKAPVKKVELPKIPGMEIARSNGTFLGVEVVGGVFKLSFYDSKKKAMPVDVTRATARWPNPRAPGDNHTVLNGSGNALIGAKPVVPPLTFNLYLTLLQGEGDNAKAVENYTVQFRG